MTRALPVLIATAAALTLVAVAAQEPLPAVRIFTVEQVSAGKAEYAKQCASCHMPDLSGNVEMPPLTGKAFLDTWGGRSTKELFEYLSTAMPYGAPPLTIETYLSITAYILQSNGGVPGTDPLVATKTDTIRSVVGK